MKNRPKVLVTMKAHRCLVTEARLYRVRSRAIRIQPKAIETMRCEKGRGCV
jgi:hypothetical protein